MEKSMKKFQSFLHTFFAYGKMAAQKHGYKSLPDSIAGLSESGVNAEHTGKSCSRLELVVRECGLMLDEMISVLWLDCHGLTYSAESVLPSGRLGSRRGGKREICIQRFIDSSLLKLHSGRNIRDIQGR